EPARPACFWRAAALPSGPPSVAQGARRPGPGCPLYGQMQGLSDLEGRSVRARSVRSRWLRGLVAVLVLVGLVGAAPHARADPEVEPITYTVRFPAPDRHLAEVEASYPTDGRASLELMMPTWTPGFYRVENYAGQVRDLAARTPDRQALAVAQPR